jgi:hypothetical protein
MYRFKKNVVGHFYNPSTKEAEATQGYIVSSLFKTWIDIIGIELRFQKENHTSTTVNFQHECQDH